MARPSNPLRNEAEEFIRLEVARVGPDGLDKAAIVRRFVERGASQSRVFEWIKGVVRDSRHPSAEPDTLEADMAVAEAALVAAERAKVLDSLPAPAQLRRVEEAAREVLERPAQPGPGTLPNAQTAPERVELAASASPQAELACLSIGGGDGLHGQIQTLLGSANRVLANCYGTDGKVRNPRMMLSAIEAARRLVETAHKMAESRNRDAVVESFMAEMLAEVRQLEPAAARAVVERMGVAMARWAA